MKYEAAAGRTIDVRSQRKNGAQNLVGSRMRKMSGKFKSVFSSLMAGTAYVWPTLFAGRMPARRPFASMTVAMIEIAAGDDKPSRAHSAHSVNPDFSYRSVTVSVTVRLPLSHAFVMICGDKGGD